VEKAVVVEVTLPTGIAAVTVPELAENARELIVFGVTPDKVPRKEKEPVAAGSVDEKEQTALPPEIKQTPRTRPLPSVLMTLTFCGDTDSCAGNVIVKVGAPGARRRSPLLDCISCTVNTLTTVCPTPNAEEAPDCGRI